MIRRPNKMSVSLLFKMRTLRTGSFVISHQLAKAIKAAVYINNITADKMFQTI